MSLAYDVSAPILNAGMARVDRPAETLAAYALAWGLTSILAAALSQIRQVGLVLADSRHNKRKVELFVLGCGSCMALVLAMLALTPAGTWLIDEVHGVDPPLGTLVRQALFWLIPIPILQGLSRLYSGLLLRLRRSEILGYATLASIGISIATVLLLLPTRFVQVQPIRLPILVTYASVLVDLSVIFWGYRRFGRPLLEKMADTKLSFSYVARFFWPLAMVMAIQGLSRPLINLFVSRGENGAEALAVLAVVYAVAHVPYGWLNELKNLSAAFKNDDHNLYHIRRFIGGCGLLSFTTMALIFWTPAKQPILERWIGLEGHLADLCGPPLILFSFFPIAVALRSHLHGVALVEHRTRSLAPSGPCRIATIAIVMLALPASAMHGATRGITALLSGFIVETLVVWWGVRRKNSARYTL